MNACNCRFDRVSLVHISNNVEVTFDFVERIVRLVAFDNAASTLLLVWMGLYAVPNTRDLSHKKIHGTEWRRM